MLFAVFFHLVPQQGELRRVSGCFKNTEGRQGDSLKWSWSHQNVADETSLNPLPLQSSSGHIDLKPGCHMSHEEKTALLSIMVYEIIPTRLGDSCSSPTHPLNNHQGPKLFIAHVNSIMPMCLVSLLSFTPSPPKQSPSNHHQTVHVPKIDQRHILTYVCKAYVRHKQHPKNSRL